MKVLIVEDQTYPLEFLEYAVIKVLPKYFEHFDSDVAKFFDDAKEKIDKVNYGFVLLDHRMPRKDVGNLENTDFDAFSGSLENIGYSLVDVIKSKNRETIIIGTSSLPKSALKNDPTPDYFIRKSSRNDAEHDLDVIVSRIKIISHLL